MFRELKEDGSSVIWEGNRCECRDWVAACLESGLVHRRPIWDGAEERHIPVCGAISLAFSFMNWPGSHLAFQNRTAASKA